MEALMTGRVQLGLNLDDLAESISFYRKAVRNRALRRA
jgi:hypothetical protein